MLIDWDTIVGLGLVAVGVATALWIAGRNDKWDRGSKYKYPSRVNFEGVSVPAEMLAMTPEQLLDATCGPQAQLMRIEKALAMHCGCEPGDGSYSADMVMAAVRDGQNWNEVLSISDEVAHWRSHSLAIDR